MIENILEGIKVFLTSDAFLHTAEAITLGVLALSKVWNKIANIKLDKQLANAKNKISELEEKLIVAADTVEAYANKIDKVEEIMGKQCDAMKVAFDNSNLSASAKLLVDELLDIPVIPTLSETPEEKVEPVVEEESVEYNEVERLY